MLKNFLITLFFILISQLSVWATNDGIEKETNNQNASQSTEAQAIPLGLSIKLLPALYWGTVGAQVEYPLNEKISLGVMIMSKVAESKDFTVKHEDFQDSGFSIDIYGKYFLKGEAPEGLYGVASLSYNTMLYFDGNTRPYTLHNRWKDFNGFREISDLVKPNPLNLSFGVGYQMIVIPQHIIADVFMGISGNMDENNSPFVQIYIAPSLGFVF